MQNSKQTSQDTQAHQPFDFSAMKASLPVMPSEEEREAERREAYAWTAQLVTGDDIAERNEESAPARFNLLSLPAWLALAKSADVPFVPARPLAETCVESFRRGLEVPEDQEAYDRFITEVKDNLWGQEMIRMEQVAPMEIKSELSRGSPMSNGLTQVNDGGVSLNLYEDRYVATLADLGSDRVRAFARPIVSRHMVPGVFRDIEGSWAAEFRVFVENGQIVGISNYYTQIELAFEDFQTHIQAALIHAQAMIDEKARLRLGVGNHALAHDIDPKFISEVRPSWVPDNWAPQDYTLDFLVVEDQRVVFLEGGPAGATAANPCCFLQEGRAMEANFLSGIALGEKAEIRPLSDAFST